MLKQVSMILLSGLLATACALGDDDGGGAGNRPDAGGGGDRPDARTGGGGPIIDAATGGGGIDGGVVMACAATPDYGEMGMLMGEASGAAASGYVSLSMEANADPDRIGVELYDMYGAFMTGGIVPGTFMITGDDTLYNECGLCVFVYDENFEIYMARSGMVELTSVTDKISGTLTNVELVHLDFDLTSPSPDGCTSRIGRVTFDQMLPPTM
jgi:hypothetical protein